MHRSNFKPSFNTYVFLHKGCSELPSPANGNLDLGAGISTAQNGSGYFGCDSGYTTYDPANATCGYNGRMMAWDRLPYCVEGKFVTQHCIQ